MGNDIILGGRQGDTLYGGSGSDSIDGQVSDFGNGSDKIDLWALGVTSFVGAIAAAGDVGAHQVGYIAGPSATVIYVDVDGVAGADLEITLTGSHALLATVFTLGV